VKSPSTRLGLAIATAWLAGHAGLASAQQTITAGQTFYQKVCAKCHEAGIGPVLLGRGLPPEAFQYFVRHGSGPMPAFRVTDIDDATLKELAQYLSTSKAPAGK
jgi:mono/diheme cytochrome c family protein